MDDEIAEFTVLMPHPGPLRAAAVEEARGKLAELRGGMVQPGDAAQEQRNDRLLGQVRTLLGEDAPITKALTVLESHAGDRNKMGLVADELRVRYPEHSSLIDQHLGRSQSWPATHNDTRQEEGVGDG